MIKAELPGGTILGFPDNTPDTTIDAAVRRYLGADEIAEVEITPEAEPEIEITEEPEEVAEPEPENLLDEKIDRLQLLVETALSENKNTTAPEIAAALDKIGDAYATLTEMASGRNDRENSHNLTMAVEASNVLIASLLEQIKEIKEQNDIRFSEIAETLSAPRKLIKDADGNPVGSEINRESK